MTFEVNDTFTLYGSQVKGTYEGYAHFALPGQYVVTDANKTEVVILKTDCQGPRPSIPFRCSQHGLRAVVLDCYRQPQGELRSVDGQPG